MLQLNRYGKGEEDDSSDYEDAEEAEAEEVAETERYGGAGRELRGNLF